MTTEETLTLLHRIEWQAAIIYQGEPIACCVECRQAPVVGHADDCQLAQLIKDTEEGRTEVQETLDRLIRLTGFSFKEAVDHWEGEIEFDNHFKNLFAGLIHAAFVKSNGINYVEWIVDTPAPSGQYIITIQRKLGKTPAQLRGEAETETQRLRDFIDGALA